MRKGEEVRNREEISKMGVRKQELEVEEIISWASRAPGENDERMGEGRAQSEAQSEEVTLHFVFVYKITKAANAL